MKVKAKVLSTLTKLTCCFALIVGGTVSATTAHATTTWNVVGTVGFGAGTHNNLTLDKNGVPYVVYAASSAIFVKKFVSGSWQDANGTASFAMRANDMIKLAFDNNNTPYMVFNNTGNGNQVEVDKLIDGEWKHVGNTNISTANGYYQNLVFDSQNNPYIAYTDFGQSTKTIVKTLSGGTWTNVGSSQPWNNSTTSVSMGIGKDDSLYVAFVDASDSNSVKVYKYSGNAWAMVGSALGTGVNSNYTVKLKMSSNDTPYVDFIDGSQSSKLTVKRFVSGAWETMGSAGFSPAADTFMSFDLDSQDIPYVAFGANSYKANVMRFVNGAWESVGGPDFINDVNRIAVAANPDDNVYFHYKSTTSTNLGVYLALLPLTGVTASGGDAQAVVTFKKPKGATSVIVEQSDNGGATWTTSATGALDENSTSATVTGLTNGTTYQFRVNVTGGVKPGISNVATATPIAPLSDVVGTPGNMQASLTFTAPAGATNVIVEQSTDGGSTWLPAATSGALNSGSTSATVTGLSNGTTYKLRVNVTGGSYPGVSNTVTVTPVGAIDNLAAQAGDTTAALTFAAPTGASSVTVEQSTDGGGTWAPATTTTALNDSSTGATVTGLTNGTLYTFRVNVTGGNHAGTSNTATARPAAPITNVAATPGDSKADLTFSAATGATSVVVEQSADGGSTWTTATTTANVVASSTGATVTGLTNGMLYKFRLVITGGAHEGNSNAASALPSLPISDLAAQPGAGQATLTFSAAAGASSVVVKQSADGGATWSTATTTGVLNASSTGATVTGLTNGTAYKFRIVATGGASNGTSNTASVTPVAPITDLAASAGDSQVNLTFSAATGATSVIVEQSTDNGSTWATATTTSVLNAGSTSTTVTGLTNGTTYKFRLVVTGGAHEGTSNTANAKPSLVIADLAATSGDSQASLSFSAAAGATSVIVEQSADGGSTWTTATTTGGLNAGSTGATVTSLTNGTTYKFRLIVTGGAREGTSNTAGALPSLPVADLDAFPGAGQASLTFSAPVGASAVAIEQSDNGGTTWTTATTASLLSASSTSATVTGLTNGTNYNFRVVVTGGARNGVSNGASATPVAPITDLAATTGDSQVHLTFSAATKASTVTVEQSDDGGTTWTTASTTVSVDSSSTGATVNGLTNGITYKFRVKAKGGARSGISNVVSAKPSLSIGDLAAAPGDSQVSLTFSPATGATSVIVEQSMDGGATWTASTVTGSVYSSVTGTVYADSTGATVTGLTNGTTYKFRIMVTGGAKEGESNIATAIPSLPLNDLTAAAGEGSVQLSFSAAAGASGVAIEQSADGGLTWTTAITAVPLDANSVSATVTGLANGTAYQFRVKATGGPRNGISNTAFATPVGVLGNLSATAGDGSVTLKFPAPAGAGSVVIEQSDDGGVTWVKSVASSEVNASSTSAAVTRLSNGKLYQFRLQISGGAYAGVSNQASATPAASSTASGGGAGPSTETIAIIVDSGKNDNQLSSGTITRTTNADGTKSDKVEYEVDKAVDTIRKVKEAGLSTVRLYIPDTKDEVSNLDVKLPKGTVNAIASGSVDMEIYTDNVRIVMPQSSVTGLNEDLYFRLIPIKKEEEKHAVEERAKKEEVVQHEMGAGTAKVVARPMTIETNISSRPVNLILPLTGVVLPTDAKERDKFLSDLVIFIEHSDGERAIAKPKIVTYKDGLLGAAFSVTKFSTFTILQVENSSATHQAYIQGYLDGAFHPSSSITRAEIAALMSRLKLGTEGQAPAVHYTDVASGNWAADSIRYVTSSGLMQGYGNDKFAPEQSITRAELAAVIARLQGLKDSGTAVAADISGHWAASEIQLVMASGIMTVDAGGNFRPDDKLTRAETVTVLNRVLKRGPLNGVTTPTWSDTPETHWAFGDIEEASRTHIKATDSQGKEVLTP